MMKLLFSTPRELLYDGDRLKKEPEESLDALKAKEGYLKILYDDFLRKEEEILSPYKCRKWVGWTVPIFIEDMSPDYCHSTWLNALCSDITLSFAADFSSPGEITTKKWAGDKFIPCQLTEELLLAVLDEAGLDTAAASIIKSIKRNPNYNKKGIRLNITGNDIKTLRAHGWDTDTLSVLIESVLKKCPSEGVNIEEVRSGGQTGADEAGILSAMWMFLECRVLAPEGFRWRDENGIDHEGREEFEDRFKRDGIDFNRFLREDREGYFAHERMRTAALYPLKEIRREIDLKIMHVNARRKLMSNH